MTKELLNVRTVLFDLDGTLADTAPDLADALNTVREQNCFSPMSYDVIRPIVSHGSNALIYLGFELSPGDEGFDAIRDQLLDTYLENIANKTRLFPGMEQVLDTLEAKGLNWGVVTNKPSWLTEPLLRQLGLKQRAACIVSGDTTTKRKPDPEPMLFACQLAGSRGCECLYVGDAERDIVAGRRAGMRTLAALFGYISEHEHPDQWGADGMIDQPQDILTWLGRAVA
ncbi:phosphoglycolate phosphatase [Candidatus Tenderia electrophaga]|jgi:phosphoglycolate phosphatase|uniref:Phosphoglycolate phosphatase n=1 Tax=Candidatus Tenderia electrophaga TaxID=1748243 RepID=A0A0S2TDL5_9GAMM|nr:phosphoglycolate phosphatase [Candidatus Tenderia electrophaga]